jgi:GNAT superfamily N-acetyltransferase
MQIIEVSNKVQAKEFLDTARVIYKNDSVWVCPLDQEINDIFDPKENVFFQNGDAIRWIVKNEKGELIGRIAAFINETKANFENRRIGGMGFFESINDQKVAFSLFDTAKAWLTERGVNMIQAPINFGENDSFWGLLVEGFTHPSNGMGYNHTYYKEFFESYGYTTKMEQLTNHLNIKDGLPERFVKIAEYAISKRPNLTLKPFDMNHFDQFAEDFMIIYNAGWKHHENFTPIKKEYVKETFKKVKPFHDPKYIWFAYIDGQPASFVLVLPDVNQILKKLNGKLNLWNKLRFVYYKKTKVMNRLRVWVMGTHPKYQNMGLESVLVYKCFEGAIPSHYEEGELSWVGDFNDKMIAIHKALGAVPAKKHITYELDLTK